MTIPGPRLPRGAAGVEVAVDPEIVLGAGQIVDVPVVLRHYSNGPATITLSVLGLDPRWVPPPLTVGPVPPGVQVHVMLRLPVERGTLAARYPFVVAAQTDGGRSAAGSASRRGGPAGASTDVPMIGIAESVLVVDAPDPVTMTVEPQQPTAVFGRRITVQLTNPSRDEVTVGLVASAASGISVSLDDDQVRLPSGRTVSVPGKLTVRRPRLFGSENTYPFAVVGRGTGAPQTVDGVLRTRPLIRGWLSSLIALGLVLALWVTIAIFAIPRLSDEFSGAGALEAAQQSAAASASAASSSAAASSASAAAASAESAAAGGGGGGGGGGAGGTAAGTPGTPGAGDGLAGSRLSGSIVGNNPEGVTIVVEPTSVVDAQRVGAEPAPGLVDPAQAPALRAGGPLGKVWGTSLRVEPTDEPTSGRRSTESAQDGTWSFAGINGPGFQLVTFAQAGYQTQRYIIDPALLEGADPMKITMVPGQGSLSGTVRAGGAPLGAAMVTITDGTTSLNTTSVSDPEGQGTWKVNGLSTPGTYLVTVAASGFGTASALVSLDAGGSATTDLTLLPGVGSITGTVTGRDQFGVVGGLGGLTVSAVNGDVTRSATTITSGVVGRFVLPDLPAPGTYTLTVTGPGFQAKTQQVTLGQGAENATVDVSLTRADGVVAGTVSDETGGGLPGAGLTLTGQDATFKTMSASAPPGSFRFSGVTPGTYVLAASLFGRQTSYATVQITAAETVTTDLILPVSTTGEVASDSRIRGRAVDVRTSGPLTCDRAATRVAECRVTVTTTMTSLDGNTIETISTSAGPGDNYTLPALDDTAHPGLLPGLYALTITAPGYESVTVNVQVAQSQVVPAPQVALQPLAMLSGKVTAVIGTPATPTCIALVTSGRSNGGACTIGPDDADGNPTCTAGTDPTLRCAVTAADGTFEMRGLSAGGYDVQAIPTDAEYLPSALTPLQIAVSEAKQFTPVLDRRGRMLVTVLAPDDVSGSLTPAIGVTVDIAPRGPVLPGNPFPTPIATLTTGSVGTALFVGLADGVYDIRVSGSDGSRNLRGRILSDPVAVNQTATPVMVATPTFDAVVGRVLTTVNGVALPLAGATVLVSGIVGFSGITGQAGTATLTTDANGCYAVLSISALAAGVQPTSAECPTPVTGAASGTMVLSFFFFTLPADLSFRTVDVAVSDPRLPARTFDYQAAGTVIASPVAPSTSFTIGSFNVAAQPVAFGVWAMQVTPGVPGLSPASSVSVTNKPLGAGNIAISVSSAGVLTWKDDAQLAANVVVPGLYRLRAQSLGYLPVEAELWCGLGQACRLLALAADPNNPPAPETRTTDPNALTLRRTGIVTGTIRLPAGATVATPLNQAVVKVLRKPDGAGTVTVTVDVTGRITFNDTVFAGRNAAEGGLAVPGSYDFTVELSGYNAQPLTINCDSGAAGRGGRCYSGNAPTAGCIANELTCNAFDTTLQSLPTFAGLVTLNLPTTPAGAAVDLSTVSITVTQQAIASSVITARVDAAGVISWQDGTLPAGVIQAGGYTLTATLPGYVSASISYSFTCGSGSCGPGTIAMRSLPRPATSFQVDLGIAGLNAAGATVAITARPSGTGALTASAIATGATTASLLWSDTALPFAGIVKSGDYEFRVNLPGYQPSALLTLSCPDTRIDATTGTDPNPNSTCTLRDATTGTVLTGGVIPLTRFPVLANSSWNLAPADPGVIPSFLVTVAPTGSLGVTLTAGAGGALTWTESGLPASLVRPGSYQIVMSATGFETRTFSFTCAQGTGCGPGVLELTKSGRLQLTLVTAGTGAAATGATVTLSGTGVASNTVTLAPSDNVVAFTNISAVDPTSYQVRVQAGGFAFLTVTSASAVGVVSCSGSAGTNVAGLRMQPGDTDCTIRLTALGRFAGSTLGVTTTTTDQLAQVLISAQRTADGAGAAVTDAPITVRSAADGTYLLTGSNQVEGLLPGSWSITASRDGYQNGVGTITVGPNGALSAATGSLLLTGGGTVLNIRLTVNPVNVRVQLRFGTTDVTSGVTVTLADGLTVIAICATGGGTSIKCTNPVSPNTFFELTAINPGVYTLFVTPTGGQYRPVSTQLAVIAGQATQSAVISLSSGSSVVSGTARSGLSQDPLVGATVALVTDANPNTPATSTTNTPLSTTSDATGRYSFTDVPDGNYQVLITLAGYEPSRSSTFRVEAALNPNVTVQAAVVTRATRTLTVSVTSTADASAAFTGASIVLEPVAGSGPEFPASNQTAAVGADNTVTFTGVPTGDYTVRAATLPGARQFSAGIYTVAASVPAFTGTGTAPAVTAALSVAESALTLTVNIPAGNCAASALTSLTATLNRTSAPTSSHSVTLSIAGNTATSGTIYVPNAAFSWTVALQAPSFWSAGTDTFTTTGAAAARTLTLVPSQVPVPLTVTLDNGPGTGVTVQATPAAGSGLSPVSTPIAGATNRLCLTPGVQWTITLSGGGTSYVGATVQLTPTVATPGTYSYTGRTVDPTVSLQAVAGRTGSTHSIVLALFAGTDLTAAALFSTTVAMAAGATDASPGNTIYVPAGDYTWTATPAAADVFGVGSSPITVPSTGTAAVAVGITVPYARVVATVTVSRGGSPQAGAAVTITAGGAALRTATTGAAGTVTLYDLAVGTGAGNGWTISATFTDTAPTPDVNYSGTLAAAPAASPTAQPFAVTLAVVP